MNEAMRRKVLARAVAIKALSTDPNVLEFAIELVEMLEGVSTAAAPDSDDTGLSMSRDAVRARARRAADVASKRQLELPSPQSAPVATAVDAGRDRGRDQRPTVSNLPDSQEVATGTTDADLDLSPSLSFKRENKRSTRRVATAVQHDPAHVPPEAIDLANSRRPDLSEGGIRRSWERFAKANPEHDSDEAAVAHWGNWIKREDKSKTGFWAPKTGPISSARRSVSTHDEDDTEPIPALLSIDQRRELQRAQLEALMAIEAADEPEQRSMSA